MVSFLLVLLTVVACVPAFAGLPATTPELDPGSLAALTSIGTVGYIVYTVYRRKAKH